MSSGFQWVIAVLVVANFFASVFLVSKTVSYHATYSELTKELSQVNSQQH